MKIGFYARCMRHKCDLEIEDYDITLSSIVGLHHTRWQLSITGWYCPVARLNEEYVVDDKGSWVESSEGGPLLACEDGWWILR